MQLMPTIFIGHGSPMNAIQNNAFTKTLITMAANLPQPKAILCISAHWLTEGTWVTGMQQPRTIHDFYGFPPELFDIQYPAPGSPEIASLVQSVVTDPSIQTDQEIWGLDHGTWSVLRHMYPNANVPVLQLSINHTRPFEFHYELGKQLRILREKEILIVGSGNIVHNLRKIKWEQNAEPYDWAVEFDQWVKDEIEKRNFSKLVMDQVTESKNGKLSIPTTEHYIPLLYVLGASNDKDSLHFDYDGIENASISMRSVRFQPDKTT